MLRTANQTSCLFFSHGAQIRLLASKLNAEHEFELNLVHRSTSDEISTDAKKKRIIGVPWLGEVPRRPITEVLAMWRTTLEKLVNMFLSQWLY
jgi:hypothetical protein